MNHLSIPHLKPAACAGAFVASALQAFGMYNIHALSQITEGGIFGLVLLLDHWFHISPSVSSFLLSGACFCLGWRVLGSSFIAYSLFAALGYSIGYFVCEQFPPIYPAIASMPFAASLIGALFIGVGAGITVHCGGATSGDDALAMSLSRITGQPIQRIYLFSDLTVLALSLSYIPVRRIGYSLLTVILSGQIIGLVQRLPTPKQFSAHTP